MTKIIDFKPAKLSNRREWLVYYSIKLEGEQKFKLVRKRINHIDASTRLQYANHVINNINQKLFSGTDPRDVIVPNTSPLLTDAIADYLKIAENGGLRPATLKDYKSNGKALIEFINRYYPDVKYVSQVTQQHAHRYFDQMLMDKKINAYTFNSHLTNLRTMFNSFVRRKYIPENWFKQVKFLLTEKKEREYITPQHRAVLAAELENNHKYFYMLCLMQYYCFVRRTEMARLKMKMFDWKQGTINIPGAAAKRREKPRQVIIPHEFYNMLIALKYHELPGSYAFVGDNVEFKPQLYNENAVTRIAKRMSDFFHDVVNDLQLPPSIKFYSWKDTGITDMANNTGNLMLAAEQAGHETTEMTKKYYHVTGTSVELLRSFTMKKETK